MTNSRGNPPASNEVEISLFGPGYGEAIAIHVCGGNWILVDSCDDSNTDLPSSLHYLKEELGSDVEESVLLIVATHWHDDHIRGLSQILEACTSADFVISSVLRTDQFLQLLSLYHGKALIRSSGLAEFEQIFELLEERRKQKQRFATPKLALMDRLVHKDRVDLSAGSAKIRVVTLSPSDGSKAQATAALAKLLPIEGEKIKRVASPTPNHSSVVLWVEVEGVKLLLGADLERTADPGTGWSVILDESKAISGQAEVFKIPHHGSQNAHHDRVWDELLINNPSSVLTPFRKGSKYLPTRSDIDRITKLSRDAYATAPPRKKRQRWRRSVVREFVNQATKDIHDVHCGWGHIRLRKKIQQPSQSWTIELFGDAYSLN